MAATRSKTRGRPKKAQPANPSKPRVSFACDTPSAAAHTSNLLATTPDKKLSPASYMRVLYERRDALRECALGDGDSETSSQAKGKGSADGLSSGDRASQLRTRVRGAMQEADPWSELGRVLKLQSTLGGKRYIGTSLTTAEPIPLPEPYADAFPETEEEWDDLRQKTAVVEKVRGWVKSVENSVEEPTSPLKGKRKRNSAGASPARKKRKEEAVVVVSGKGGYDPKDPSPLGFVVAKKVPVQAKPRVLVPSSSPPRPPPSSSPAPPGDEEMESPPPHRPSISSVPEDAFFPPSFPSHLVTSTPPQTRLRARPVEEPSEDVLRKDVASKPLSTAKDPISAPKPLSSANLALHLDSSSASKLYLDIDLESPTKSLSSIAGDDDDEEDDEILLGAAGLADEEAPGLQFDLQSEVDDLEGFLERDVSMYGDEDGDEAPGVQKSKYWLEHNEEVEEHDDEGKDEDAAFGKWFNLPRNSASTSGSGGGGWFGRR
ncbi:hypothetical protein BDZ89DRAFT_1110891 [Hymenopellis radicata]|nr:hypothetical protein BDZ89DRAFT_1110891 [Hymenopellis radicata]